MTAIEGRALQSESQTLGVHIAARLSSQEQSAAKKLRLRSPAPLRVDSRMVYAFVGAYSWIIAGLSGCDPNGGVTRRRRQRRVLAAEGFASLR